MLKDINSPSDLKKLPPNRLEDLAQEIREILINTVANNGGHLAANLGVVELTLALHYVYDSPRDKLIWDVGHQSYVHKMITGRCDQIDTLRCYQGLSGFPKVEESPHDVFNTGHSSTSISAAVGMALARDLREEDHSVVAVIGDGALTGGMAFEALNHAGHLGLDLTVVLNDNAMSISPNVGALAEYLRKMRMEPEYTQKKKELEQALKRIPAIGHNLVKVAAKLKDALKYMVVPGMLFEELGFTYFGPVGGHNLEDLIVVFQKARRKKGPVLIHVITKKGMGYPPATDNPDRFHGIGPFDVATGIAYKGQAKTYSQVFSEYILNKGEQDPKVVAITAAMADGTGLNEFAQRFPQRFFDVGICEQHAVTMAAGIARGGLRPLVAIYSSFLQRSFDQIIHDVCLQNLPVVFAIDRAGLVGEDGPTHHGVFDISYLSQIPNMVIMAPANADEMKDMLESAFAYEQPAAVRYPRGTADGAAVKEQPEVIPLGQAKLLSEGNDVLLIGLGRGVKIACEAAEILKRDGVSCAVINARFAKPLDQKTISEWVRRCQRVVTIEDNVLIGGFGSAVVQLISAMPSSPDIIQFGIPDRFVEHGDVEQLFKELGMDADSIAQSILYRWPELRRSYLVGGI